ncbi:MAG TPA: hypothetical protein VHA55_10455 [Pseudorhodoplanes sp.]|jgi:hypothetical protein|nr:hypothetical protein [Pseudorhodoplanes sp.]
MLLSDILSRFGDASAAAEAIVGLGDLILVARLERAAGATGCSLGEYAAWAMRHYAANAPDEEWITLLGVMGHSPDPGAVCMKRALTFVLQHECGQGEDNACATACGE